MRKFEACLFKRPYESESEAAKNGMETYFCLYCGKYHCRMSKENKKKEPRWVHQKRFFACAKRRRSAAS